MLGLGLGLNKNNVIGKNEFISTWKTDNTSTGSSANNQVKFPLISIGTYNFVVDWGDGNKDTITAHNQAEVTHTYSNIGTYDIKIKGQCEGWQFNNSGDIQKLLNISNWGKGFVNFSAFSFWGCSNMTITANDTMKSTGLTSMSYFFRDCLKINSKVKIDTSNVIDMSSMFQSCSVFNAEVNHFNTQKVTTTRLMFSGCGAFNQLVNNWDTSKVRNLSYMFNGCGSFNKLVNSFNTNAATNLSYMFNGCSSFNQDISTWNIENVTNMANMLTGATAWSRGNYDKALISWAGQNVQAGVTFNCSSTYTVGGDAEAAKTFLTITKGWSISDNGGV